MKKTGKQETLKNPIGVYLVSPIKTNYQMRPVMRLYGFIN